MAASCQTGTVTFAPLPATACWEHRAARSGFEVAFFGPPRGPGHLPYRVGLPRDAAGLRRLPVQHRLSPARSSTTPAAWSWITRASPSASADPPGDLFRACLPDLSIPPCLRTRGTRGECRYQDNTTRPPPCMRWRGPCLATSHQALQLPGSPGITRRPPVPKTRVTCRFPGTSRVPGSPPDGSRFQR